MQLLRAKGSGGMWCVGRKEHSLFCGGTLSGSPQFSRAHGSPFAERGRTGTGFPERETIFGTAGTRVIGQVLEYSNFPKCYQPCVRMARSLLFNPTEGRRMRSMVINRILSFQYRLGKLIGRRKAARICVVLDRAFTSLFGREVYNGRE